MIVTIDNFLVESPKDDCFWYLLCRYRTKKPLKVLQPTVRLMNSLLEKGILIKGKRGFPFFYWSNSDNALQ